MLKMNAATVIKIPTTKVVILIGYSPIWMKNPSTAAAKTSFEMSDKYFDTASNWIFVNFNFISLFNYITKSSFPKN